VNWSAVSIATVLKLPAGLVNYNSDEANRIKGQSTESISGILGYREDDELIHRDNLVIS
jgi:glutamate 5-kinase